MSEKKRILFPRLIFYYYYFSKFVFFFWYLSNILFSHIHSLPLPIAVFSVNLYIYIQIC
uniref:Uncharacterized protein n=1 Tax=Helianthus annuus TaxID=4232 RepID=A0A251TEM3_HELAN